MAGRARVLDLGAGAAALDQDGRGSAGAGERGAKPDVRGVAADWASTRAHRGVNCWESAFQSIVMAEMGSSGQFGVRDAPTSSPSRWKS